MTRPSRLVVDIERIVLDGLPLDASGVAAARAAIVDGLTAWLAELDASALQSLATARVTASLAPFDVPPDGRALGRSVSKTIRRVIDDARADGGRADGGRAGCPSRPIDPSRDGAP